MGLIEVDHVHDPDRTLRPSRFPVLILLIPPVNRLKHGRGDLAIHDSHLMADILKPGWRVTLLDDENHVLNEAISAENAPGASGPDR